MNWDGNDFPGRPSFRPECLRFIGHSFRWELVPTMFVDAQTRLRLQ